MKSCFRLARDPISHDTILALEELLEDARAGNIIGIAFVAMYKQRTFIVEATGEAHRNPIFTRGMLRCLDDKLSC